MKLLENSMESKAETKSQHRKGAREKRLDTYLAPCHPPIERGGNIIHV